MASPAVGLGSYVGTGKETTYGTSVARDHWVPIRSESIALSEPPLESESIQEIGALTTRTVPGPIDVAGDIVMEAQPVGMGRFLEYVLGSVSTTTPDPTNAAAARRHTYQIQNELPTSLTVEVFRGNYLAGFGTDRNKSFLYMGCQVGALSFEQSAGGLLIVTASILARDVGLVSKGNFTPSTTAPFRFNQALLTWGGTSTDVSDLTLTVNNNLGDDRRFLGSRLRSRAERNSWLEVSGSFTTEFQGTEHYSDFRNATTRQLQIVYTGANIGGSINYELLITCPVSLIREGAQPVVDGAGRVTVPIGFRAYRSATQKEIEIRITNESASSD